MRRILMVLTVALVMAAMLVVMAAPAFAKLNGDVDASGNCTFASPFTCIGGQSFRTAGTGDTGGSGGNRTGNVPDPENNTTTSTTSGGGGRQGGGAGGRCTGETSDLDCVGSPGVRT